MKTLIIALVWGLLAQSGEAFWIACSAVIAFQIAEGTL